MLKPPETESNQIKASVISGQKRGDLVFDFLLLIILLIGAYFRINGVNWDEMQYLHPDERFLAMVESGIDPVESVKEYFDPASSSLNPHNRGFGFFVYGTLPIFLVRYVAEWVGKANYGGIAIVGRPLSAIFDLGTVFVMFLIVRRVYGKRVALLAATFSSLAVLQIQLSHFFTVDIFANFFIWLSLYFAVRVAMVRLDADRGQYPIGSGQPSIFRRYGNIMLSHQVFFLSLFFAISHGMAVASKISAGPVALMLPLAGIIYLSRVDDKRRFEEGAIILAMMIMAAIISLIVFRIFQPYAFSGPGFFGLWPNDQWLDNLRALSGQVQPESGFPPSVQWYNRPIWFAGLNLTLWGIGLPMGIIAWSGFIWMGWRIFVRKEWRQHLLVWSWVGLYFFWQSSVPNPTMRYQLPVYPGMAIFAAWAITCIWDLGRQKFHREYATRGEESPSRETAYLQNISNYFRTIIRRWGRYIALVIGVAALVGTILWAFAFSQIYNRQVTRIEASRWIFQNIPGPVNLQIQNGQRIFSQPLPFPDGLTIRAGEPYVTSFIARSSGDLEAVSIYNIDSEGTATDSPSVFLMIMDDPEGIQPLASTVVSPETQKGSSLDEPEQIFPLNRPINLEEERTYHIIFELLDSAEDVDICSPINLHIQTNSGPYAQVVANEGSCVVHSDHPLNIPFVSEVAGTLNDISLQKSQDLSPKGSGYNFKLVVSDQPIIGDEIEGNALAIDTFTSQRNDNGFPYSFEFDEVFSLIKDQTYYLSISLEEGSGAVSLIGTAIATESSWDDALPMRLDGFDGYGGIYQGGLNFELYWDDNVDKRERMIDILNQAEVLTISSSRQWASITRLPEKYPLTIAYYRNLLGCPENRTIEWCYNVAEPGMFSENLGFTLVKTFQSNPSLGHFQINDQFSEEAFTVYDHPKVFIFVKSADFTPFHVREILESVSLGQTLGDIGAQEIGETKSLLLSPERFDAQKDEGTWSRLFDTDRLVNRFYPLTVFIWYLMVSIVGFAVYPLVRIALPGLSDRGYPLARTAGLLILSYVVWILGSFNITVNQTLITLAMSVLVVFGVLMAYWQRETLIFEWRSNRRFYLFVEFLGLAFFVVMLLIRLGNPDLWHPWKGGEKPMDFSYFNAVLKSISYPPYDPWFSGGYINYYYYGFLYVGVLVKWLGIVPTVAYNLILPTLFSILGLGAFSIGWNIQRATAGARKNNRGFRGPGSDTNHDTWEKKDSDKKPKIVGFRQPSDKTPYLIGIASAVGIAVLGNLGTLQMIFQGYQRLVLPTGIVLDDAFFLTRWFWGIQGFFKALMGESLTYSIGDWYWIPSRVIPAPGDVAPITEFPFFTFLYADLHAHMIALPITVLALAWAVSVVLARARWEGRLSGLMGFVLGGLVIGSLRPTNTWDFPTYLAIGILAVGTSIWRYYRPSGFWSLFPVWLARLMALAAGVGYLAVLSFLLFQPYARWYALGYTTARIWDGTHTPVSAYLTHWGLFLYLILSWMLWETREWMANTPISDLRRLIPYREIILGAIVVLLGLIGWLMISLDVHVAWFILPLLAWTGVLLFRPGISDSKRLILFLIGTGLFLTLMVEVIVLSGDIGRMNTVFKFYLQVWVLFSISAAAALGWLISELSKWRPHWQFGWQIVLAGLVMGASMYPFLGGAAKIEDRMSEEAPRTLDGMAFMPFSKYNDQGRELSLDEDYRAIRWLQENVSGSPVIVEGNTVEYRWGSRYSIYTGLPSVVGWNWHQRQQRAADSPEEVVERVAENEIFYLSTDEQAVSDYLKRYDVGYIIVGQLERAYYDGPGIEKFELYDGILWREVYRDGETSIYEVIGS